MSYRRVLLLVVVLALGGCSPPAVERDDDDSPEPPAFDLALVKSNFTEECTNPTFDVEFACQQMEIDGMTADGSILNVPTRLDPSGDDRADVICGFLATVHYDRANGDDLGYDTVGIFDTSGGNLATCTTVSP